MFAEQYMTEGVLLRESLREPDLDQYRYGLKPMNVHHCTGWRV